MTTNVTFSAAQRLRIRQASKGATRDPSEGGELNIVPLLDVVMNVMLFVLATVTTVFTSTIAVPAPSGPNGGGAGPLQGLTVKVTRDGFIVGAQGGFLQSDCQSLGGAHVTVPTVMGAHDFNALTQCLSRARRKPEWRANLEGVRSINVAGNGELPYITLVRTLDAVRETRPLARDLFPDPRLGVL